MIPAQRSGAAAGSGPASPPSPERIDFSGAVKAPFPESISPMLATLVDGPFDREGWSFEVKWDGFRSIAEIRGGDVRLVSRNGKVQNARFPTVAAALSGFPVDAVFDGEIVAGRGGRISRRCKIRRAPGKAGSSITSSTSFMRGDMTSGGFLSSRGGPFSRSCCLCRRPCA